AIDFAGVETAWLTLGDGDDQPTIGGVSDDLALSVLSGLGNDDITVGHPTLGLSRIQGLVELNGGAGGEDTVVLDDAASGNSTKVGTLSDRAIVGLGMGDLSEGVRYESIEGLELNLGTNPAANTVSSDYDLNVLSIEIPTTINLGDADDSVRVGPDLFRIKSELTVNAGGTVPGQDQLTLKSNLATDLTLDGGNITASDMPGEIEAAQFEAVRITLSNSPDTVTVLNTDAELNLETLDGADRILIADTSHQAFINLGADTDDDLLTVKGAGLMLMVSGDAAGTDTVIVDVSENTIPGSVTVADSSLAEAVSLSGATPGEILAKNLAEFDLLLGQGNDTVDVDTAGNLSATNVRIDGGSGDDTFTVTTLGSRTVWSGGRDDDSAVISIAGVPTSDQFNHLRLDTEQLVVDNTTNSASVAWTLTDLSLIADERIGDVPAGSPVQVLSTDGVGRTRILAGSGNDSLEVITTTITETFGEIELDSNEQGAYEVIINWEVLDDIIDE
ncbi:MAG: hypothetical protein MI861_18525, partial [Pirellulales bacterium]|nr:hypothetical protein [Pirellulales bacterium]